MSNQGSSHKINLAGFAYNARGEQEVAALDLNGNGIIDYTADRITKTVNTVAIRDTHTVQRSTTQVWETDSQDAPTTVSVAETSSDGLRSWQTIRGLTTGTVTTLDGFGGRTVTTTAPDGTKSIQVYANDHLTSTTVKTAADAQLGAATYAYDAHQRQISATDARNGTTTFAYFADDQLQSTTTPDPDLARSGPGYDPQTTTFGYDSAGRPSVVTQSDGGIVTTEYYPTGLVKKVSGARTYPVEYTYDPQGRVKTLKTWQDHAGNTGAAVTTWNYDSQRGFLLNKRYNDNTGPAYTYYPSGRLHTRTWARGVTTTYTHNSAGDLASVDYSDATPDVTLTYDRAGRQQTRTDAAGACTWTYHPSGQLQDEVYSSGLLGGLSVNRSFDALARLSGLSVPSVNSSVTYSYDAASRLDTVTSGINTATYNYVTNSSLVGGLAFKQSGNTRLTTSKSHDDLNRLSGITNTPSAASALSVFYQYNNANQRTKLTRESNAYWDFGYDLLGQVTAAKKYLSGGGAILGHDFAYTFDDIGNRKTATVNSQTSNYAANLLNQYDSRTVPGIIDVFGAAQADATVTVTHPAGSTNILPTTRQGELFNRQLTVNNAGASQFAEVKITGVKNNVGPAGEDAVTEETRSVLVTGTPEVFTHDADGNLTGDGKWTYTWDGENRLVAMETSASAAAAGVAKQKLEFNYDGQNRRIQKKVFSWNLALATWNLESGTLFLYDGWNLLAELNALSGNAAVRTYTWGLDLSGSLQGAGGVGGLLFSNVTALSSPLHAPCYDGNGNVIGLVDMTTGAKSATYDYNAFGETLIADGPAATSFPFRFSTKYTDIETGLLYYGLRYYSPVVGRWLSRDPIHENGGLNLFGALDNDPVNYYDALGRLPAGLPGLAWDIAKAVTQTHLGNKFKGGLRANYVAAAIMDHGKIEPFETAPLWDELDDESIANAIRGELQSYGKEKIKNVIKYRYPDRTVDRIDKLASATWDRFSNASVSASQRWYIFPTCAGSGGPINVFINVKITISVDDESGDIYKLRAFAGTIDKTQFAGGGLNPSCLCP